VFAGPSEMEQQWDDAELKLVQKWSASMPQLRAVALSYGYSNREGMFISVLDHNRLESYGRRNFVHKDSKLGWLTGYYSEDIFHFQRWPFSTVDQPDWGS
jgi:hypothetical protein